MTTETAESAEDSSIPSRATRQAMLARMRWERHDFVPETWSTRWRRHRRRVGAIAIVLLLVVAGGILTVRLMPSAANTVTAYLEAVRDGDVKTALKYVKDRPTGSDARFLVPEALSDDWSIVGVSGSIRDDYVVHATIESHGSTAHADFHANQDEKGDWYIDDPFEYVEFPGSPFAYADVNGEIAKPGVYRLFPGVYTFHRSIDGLLSFQDKPQLMMPRHDSAGSPTPANPEIELGDEAQDRIQEALNARLDACTEAVVSDPPKCPFGTSVSHSANHGSLPFTPKDLRWTIEGYPTVKITDIASDNDPSSAPQFIAVSAQDGAATLSGTRTVDRKSEEFTLRCTISKTDWSVGVSKDEKITLAPAFTGIPMTNPGCEDKKVSD